MEKAAIEQELVRAGWGPYEGSSGHLLIDNTGDLSILTAWTQWTVSPTNAVRRAGFTAMLASFVFVPSGREHVSKEGNARV